MERFAHMEPYILGFKGTLRIAYIGVKDELPVEQVLGAVLVGDVLCYQTVNGDSCGIPLERVAIFKFTPDMKGAA